jgi:hypothetical protein
MPSTHARAERATLQVLDHARIDTLLHIKRHDSRHDASSVLRVRCAPKALN